MKRFASTLLFLGFLAGSLCAPAAYAAEIAGYKTQSDKPIKYQIRLGEGAGAKTMLMVLDESKGTGTGYDTLLADTNLNGKLDDDMKVSPTGPRKDNFSFEVSPHSGSSAGDAIYTFGARVYKASDFGTRAANQNSAALNTPQTFITCNMVVKKGSDSWAYLFLSSREKRDRTDPDLRLLSFGTPVSLEMQARFSPSVTPKLDKTAKLGTQPKEAPGPGFSFSSTMKDAEGNVLRVVRHNNKEVRPHLLVKNAGGASLLDKDLEYG